MDYEQLVIEVLEDLDDLFPRPVKLELELSHTGRAKYLFGKTSVLGPDSFKITLYTNTLSRLSEVSVIDVIRHEFSHMLHCMHDLEMSHNARWRHFAILCGARPQGSGSDEDRKEWAATHGT